MKAPFHTELGCSVAWKMPSGAEGNLLLAAAMQDTLLGEKS